MRKIIQSIAVAVLLGVQLWSCAEDKFIGEQFTNQPPTVWLTGAPPEGDVLGYTVEMWWGGWDPDGEIKYYEYAITNNEGGVFDPADTTSTPNDYKWSRVVANDSIFTFTADEAYDSTAIDFDGGIVGDGTHKEEEYRRNHTFFIRSVDEMGARSEAVYRSFTSRTLSPVVLVTIPAVSPNLNAATVPPITTFRWTGRDYISNTLEITDPVAVRHVLEPVKAHNDSWDETLEYIQNPNAPSWSEWRDYQAPGDSGKFWTSPIKDQGHYYFAVQVMDEAGAISPVLDLKQNLRRVLVGSRSGGPTLQVRNSFIGATQSTGLNAPPTVLDLPAGVTLEFEFRAAAQHYGGVVSGYRYGWDIQDANDPEQWEVDWTPFLGVVDQEGWTIWEGNPSRAFFFGTHVLLIQVIDNNGYISQVEVRVNVVNFTFEKPVLLVDDWDEGFETFSDTNGRSPSDAEHDLFWQEMLSSVVGFDPVNDVFELNIGGVNSISILDISKYQNIVWYGIGSVSSTSTSFLSELIRFRDPTRTLTGGKVQPPLISLFMGAGGHVMVAGEMIMSLSINPTSFTGGAVFPIIFRYELSGDQDGRYTGDGNDVGKTGVGDRSFAYADCCLNVLDLTLIGNPRSIRNPGRGQELPPGTGCPVHRIRDYTNGRTQGMRDALAEDLTTGGGFPELHLRNEVAGPGRTYDESKSGIKTDIYNPTWFATETKCGTVVEYDPPRPCLQPIYSMTCLCPDPDRENYGQTVAFWTSVHANKIPLGGVGARSVIWGFHPVYFEPTAVKQAMEIILHDEWQLPRQP